MSDYSHLSLTSLLSKLHRQKAEVNFIYLGVKVLLHYGMKSILMFVEHRIIVEKDRITKKMAVGHRIIGTKAI